MSDKKSHCNYISSDVVLARALYSASVVDRVTTNCFLLCHESKEVLSKKQYLTGGAIISWITNPISIRVGPELKR